MKAVEEFFKEKTNLRIDSQYVFTIDGCIDLMQAYADHVTVCPNCGGKDIRPYKGHFCCYECSEFFEKPINNKNDTKI